MKKRFFISYLPLLLFWIVDFYTKKWSIENPSLLHFGYLNINYHENHGIIFGSFEKLPLIIRTVFLSTIGIIIISSYPLFMNLIHFNSKKMVLGISLIFSGILGNVSDRMYNGYVVDMIYFDTPLFTTPVFNIADAVQWVGYLLVLLSLRSELNYHLPLQDKREPSWIYPRFQIHFSLVLCSLVFFSTSVPIFFSLIFFKYLLSIQVSSDQVNFESYYISFFITLFFIQAFFCLFSAFIGKRYSARIAGPYIAILRYVNHTLEGKNYPFKLRENDYFKEIESSLTELNERHTKIQNNEIEKKI